MPGSKAIPFSHASTHAAGGTDPLTGVLVDVTTTKGDILVRSSTAIDRLPVGDAGYLPQADPDATLGLSYRASELHGTPRTGAGVYAFTVAYDAGTRTWTLTPTGAYFYLWIQGKRYKYTGVQTVTHAATNGSHFCYADSAGTLTTATTPWDILTTAQIAYVLWHSTDGAVLSLEERHAADRDARWHQFSHYAIGTSVKGTPGVPTLSGYTLSTATTAGVSWALTTFTVADEDIEAATDAVTDGGAAAYPVLYRDGAAGDWRRVTATFGDGSGVPFATSGGTIAYNQIGTGLTPVTLTGLGSYVNVYVFGTTEHTASRRVFLIPGQTTYSTLADAQAAALTSDITWGAQSPTENVAVYRLTYLGKTSHGTTSHYAALAGVQALLGSRVSSVVAPVTSHTALTGLGWTAAGHTSVATGDLPYWSAPGTPAALTIGSEGQVLTVSGGVPAWTSIAAMMVVTSFIDNWWPNAITDGGVDVQVVAQNVVIA